ncbi:uncharacterized protein UV8b_07626 [Ustilaginoidea virens]|uniref:Secreted protein n=1 Tax=Ustilaginoidea virens TaxID=1159556 RepID=A0A8E5HXU8_USTVR|nr:uncharacterized protein UV8b_07626 [Ustilaginoidea virens]QUC23385.1 hypothetical protein UV8b_07626 [Ustilaginoidea virens]
MRLLGVALVLSAAGILPAHADMDVELIHSLMGNKPFAFMAFDSMDPAFPDRPNYYWIGTCQKKDGMCTAYKMIPANRKRAAYPSLRAGRCHKKFACPRDGHNCVHKNKSRFVDCKTPLEDRFTAWITWPTMRQTLKAEAHQSWNGQVGTWIGSRAWCGTLDVVLDLHFSGNRITLSTSVAMNSDTPRLHTSCYFLALPNHDAKRTCEMENAVSRLQ